MMNLSLPFGGKIELSNGLPKDYRGPVIMGAVSRSISSSTIDLVVQELEGENFSIRYGVGKFLKRAIVQTEVFRDGFYAYFMLKGSARKKIGTNSRYHIREDQYISLFTGGTSCEAVFERNAEFQMFDVFISPALLNELLPVFPQLKNTLQKLDRTNFQVMQHWVRGEVAVVIHEILSCPFDDHTREYFFELKVRELVFKILRQDYQVRKMEVKFSNVEKAKILRAKSILDAFLSEKPPSMRKLAMEVGLNAFKLKAGFKQYFNSGVFEWIMNRRLIKAKELLETTDIPLKELCKMVGYKRPSNFVTAFRRKFGVTPGALRR